MSPGLRRAAVPILHYTVGLVIFVESASFAFSTSAARSFAHTHLPLWLRPALGGVELAAALLFLIPRLAQIGGYALLGIITLAVLIHILHGWYDVGGLLVYDAAILVCLSALTEKRHTP